MSTAKNDESVTKNFEKCNDCDRAGIDCAPFLLSLSSEDLLEWCRIRKKHLRITNEELAEKANVASGTVGRLLRAKGTDFIYSSMQPVVLALLDVDADKVSCQEPSAPDEERIAALVQQHKEEMERQRRDDQQTIDILKKQLENEHETSTKRLTAIKWLGVSLGFTLVLIIVALIIDRLNPEIGFFWLGELFNNTGSGLGNIPRI